MSNNKQTSVEQLFHKLWDTPKDKFTWYAILEDHMAIHKEEIIDAANKLLYHGTGPGNTAAAQYYNETYGDPEQAIIDYNKMEEESEMDDYNNLSND
jgi:hypothetical protein